MTNDDGTQRPPAGDQWNGQNPPQQNPYSQAQPPTGQQGEPQPGPDPYGQVPPNPYSQTPPNPYSQTSPEPNPYGQPPQQAQDPYTQAQSTSAYPQPNAYSQAQPTSVYPQPAGASAPTEVYPSWGGQPPVEPPRKKRKAWPWIAASVVLVLLIAGGVVGLNLGNAAHAPELQVKAYLDALKKGDAEAALTLSGAKVEKTDLLLTDEAYGNAEDKITRYTIADSSVQGDAATVTATITQGGEKYDQEFSLVKTGKDALIFDKWALEAPSIGMISVGVVAPEDAVIEVSGVDASSARNEGVVELRALPGTYPVELGGDPAFYDAEPTSASVVGFGGEAAETEPLVIALTDEGTQAATDAVNAWLDDCIASTELAPSGCPFEATNSENYEITNLVWTVTKPTFTIAEFSDGSWAVVTDAPGEAKATADARDPSTGGTGQIFTEPFSFDIGGVIEGFTDDGATFVPAE